jgi:hypothetical protein
MRPMPTATGPFLDGVRKRAAAAGVFSDMEIADGMLRCAARASAAPAWFRLEADGGQWFVSLVTPDRWLSESIEADLMHHGDPLEELIEEELVELGFTSEGLVVQHYRSEDLLYTFRSPLPVREGSAEPDPDTAATFLLAYEAAFRELGDMEADDE